MLKAAGFKVHSLSVITDGYPLVERDPNSVVVSSAELSKLGYPWVMWDFALGRHATSMASIRSQIAAVFAQSNPDVIILDQPWLAPIAFEFAPDVPFIYSSQNVEFRLKEVNLKITKQASGDLARFSNMVQDLEVLVTQRAQSVIAVSEADSQWLTEQGALRSFVAANGCEQRTSSPSDVRDCRYQLDNRRYALLVASGHPPNAIGFWEMLGPSLGYLNPDQLIVAAGSVGPQLRANPIYLQHRAANNSRLRAMGFQPTNSLNALIAGAHCVVLPITQGEGSNLKTAEALLSNRPIVATSHAFRGFEEFQSLPGVFLADDAPTFRSLVSQLLSEEPQHFSRPSANRLLWTNTLQPLVQEVRRVANNAPARSGATTRGGGPV